MPTNPKLFLHSIRAKDISLKATTSNEAHWIDLKVGDFEITLFAADATEYQHLKDFFMVEDEHDREINEAHFRAHAYHDDEYRP